MGARPIDEHARITGIELDCIVIVGDGAIIVLPGHPRGSTIEECASAVRIAMDRLAIVGDRVIEIPFGMISKSTTA